MSKPDDVIDLETLVPDPDQARRHTERNVQTIVDAIREVGVGRSLVIDEKDVVLAGNATTKAAKRAGITKVRVVEPEPGEIIAVRRRDLSPQEKRRLALYDNRAGEFASWDVDVLERLQVEGTSLDRLFTREEQDRLLEAAHPVERLAIDQPPPKVAWVLVGIPLTQYASAAEHVAALEAVAIVHTTVLRGAKDE